MGRPTKNLLGMRFGRLTVIRFAGITRDGKPQALWLCQCDCGNTPTTYASNLQSKHTKSCGCLESVGIVTHGHVRGKTRTREYLTWASMKARCNNPTAISYKYYGALGVTVCERWKDFSNFLADMGTRPEGMSIDRFPDKNGNYEPGNCRWATPKEQNNNLRPQKPRKPRE